MIKLLKNRTVLIVVALIAVAIAVFAIKESLAIDKAHSTFENYYAFRGCAQLLNKSNDSAQCQTKSGQIIKIVKFNNKWYLDGDLPICWRNICL